ncbi:hypothetical protein F0562_010177 [Nyssa sinensis]|uniref:Terpene synthase N-terminal domain-containing protein n=1 Tax=Nyssa sinensis TaxID=561372 RepID=A0A5J5A0T1_9ASTE|nr:hypothetical protein F0562_010177 [Nyssa sinensis]
MTHNAASPSQNSSTEMDGRRTGEVIRRSANYHPSVWDDFFIVSGPGRMEPNPDVEMRVRVLKSEVQMMLKNATNKPLEEMILIDALQRLGVAYLFENEINEALQSVYAEHVNCNINNGVTDDLYTVALSFRLLRQQGYHISSDVFKKFKDEKGEFKTMLTNDARALLCFYEALHLRVKEEDILEEALTFSTKHLKSMLPYLNAPLAQQVKNSLETPLHKGMPRLEARRYISVYEADVARHASLLELAKLDFNLLQALHQREISDISRWWKEINLASKLPFARDRLAEVCV